MLLLEMPVAKTFLVTTLITVPRSSSRLAILLHVVGTVLSQFALPSTGIPRQEDSRPCAIGIDGNKACFIRLCAEAGERHCDVGIGTCPVEDQRHRRRCVLIVFGRNMDEAGTLPPIDREFAGVIAGAERFGSED